MCFIGGMISKDVSVYFDGFNMYHALHDLGENHLKWVDLWALSEKLIRPERGEKLCSVKYFTAYATWLESNMRRHEKYVAALEASGVTTVLGRFKKKPNKCRKCGNSFISHEEKETDVNIGAHLMADALQDRFHRALVVSADTDLNGVVNFTASEAKNASIDIVAPPGRLKNNSMSKFEIAKGKVRKSLLPAKLTKDGKQIIRPKEYDPPVS